MLVILIGLVAAAGAAPHFPFSDESDLESMINDEMFGMNNFWRQFNREMSAFGRKMSEMSRNLPHVVTKEGVQGNEYIVEIPLNGFKESDISVKARQGVLRVVAQHDYGIGSSSNYIIVRSLPDCVGSNGDWTYENGVLKIVFPLNTSSNGSDVQTDESERSREEIETDNKENNVNADVGLDNDSELETNNIPTRNPLEGKPNSDYEFVTPYYRNKAHKTKSTENIQH